MFSINGFKMGDLFSGALSGWRDWSFKLHPWQQDSSKNEHGSPIYCGTMEGYGASVFNADGGVLNGKRTLELVMKTFNGQSPSMTITLQSSKVSKSLQGMHVALVCQHHSCHACTYSIT
jgi:hypothetical protein